MKHLAFTIALLAGTSVAACANSGAGYDPITDGPRTAAYERDLQACQQIATERGYLNDDTKTDAAIGAGIGALAGLADDEVSDTEGVIAGAVIGAIAGGGAGMLEAREQRRDIVIDCMRGRGHRAVG